MPPEEKCQLQVGLERWTFQYAVQYYLQVASSFHTIQPHCLYSGLGMRLYTRAQSAWTGFTPYYPVGHYQSSVGPYQWRSFGYRDKNCLHSEYYWCADILQIRCHSSVPAALAHWSIHSYQSRVLTDTCRLQVVVIRVELHIANMALQFTLANFSIM